MGRDTLKKEYLKFREKWLAEEESEIADDLVVNFMQELEEYLEIPIGN